jgi:hypothetical protein
MPVEHRSAMNKRMRDRFLLGDAPFEHPPSLF